MAEISARTEEELRNRTGYSMNLDPHRTSFDEECRKIQNGGSRVNSRERSFSNVSRQDSKLFDHLMESPRTAMKLSRRAYESCWCQSIDATSSIHKQPPTSADMSSNNAAIPRCQEAKLCEGFPMSSTRLEKHERIDLQQPQMSAKDFVDQIIADRKLICNEMATIESKPFSKALEVLNSDKDLFIKLLSAPFCLPHNCFKNLQTERAATKPAVSNGSSTSLVSFSVREIKRKLKHKFGSRRKESNQLPKFRTSTKLCLNRSVFGQDCIYSGVETKNPLSSTTNVRTKENLGKKQGLKVERETQNARKKIDVSSDRLLHGSVDASLAARLKDLNAISDQQNPWRVISSLEIDSRLTPRRGSRYFSGSAQMSLSPCRHSTCLSPMRGSKEVEPYDGTTDTLSISTSSSLVPSSDDEQEQEEIISPTPDMKFNDLVETDDVHDSEAPHDTEISNKQIAGKIKLHNQEYGSLMHSIMDSRTEDDFPSSPTLDNNTKYQEEHQSPVSVLDQFFAEDTTSPSNIVFQSTRGPLKPRRLHFEEHKSASSPQDTLIRGNPCMHDQDYKIQNYVHLIFEASSLNWYRLSAIRPQSEHLLHPSLFDQAQFLLFDSHFDTRLLFDHVNEVLLKIQHSHFISPYWPAFARPRICCLPLEEAVVDEIMREVEFYLLTQTQRRTLDQLVLNDFLGSRLWPDFRSETEQIIVHISEDILEESVLDVVFQLLS